MSLSLNFPELMAPRSGQGAPTYTYNPSDQSYTLIGQGGGAGQDQNIVRGLGGMIMQMLHKNQPSAPRYDYNPGSQTYTQLASGGAVDAAQQVQSQGRGQDTVLVHMTPGEVKGLQALAMSHGGSLTINPQTGLPEAGFLSSLLPMLVGGALTVASGGALSPLMAAGLVGAGYGVATGSLKKGLMAGLGAYGGAGLGAGLVGAGQAASSAAGTAAISPEAAAAGVTGPAAPTVSGWEAAKLGAQNVFEPGGFKAITSAMPVGSGTASTIAGLSAMTPETPKPGAKPISYMRPYKFEWNPNEQAYTPSPTPGDSSERRYFTPTFTPEPIYKAAGGGLLGLTAGGTPGDRQMFTESPQEAQFDDERGIDGYAAGGYKRPKARSLEGDEFYKFAQDRKDSSMKAAVEQNFAAGGLGAAKQSLPPRFLSGGGDGMSDSIKANIDGKQEARLADGEFVVPADVVSHLGNGSSKAGAKKLYSMMDRIRKARTGKTSQAPAVNTGKLMPA